MDPTELLRQALGKDPFPWQRRLLRDLVAVRVPERVELPAGLGKSSVMTIWLVARACGATRLPRRLVYVVDRYAAVDHASRQAEVLRAWSQDAGVRRSLGLEGPLPISTLRGSFVDSRDWLEDPSIPAIVVGTVDTVGSRLLFEGCACSRKLRPYQAGLLACDTLFVLDDAPVICPFERMLRASQRADFWPDEAARVVPRSRVLTLSGCGRVDEASFRLGGEDLEHPIVRKRMSASKAVRVERLPASGDLASCLARRAWDLAERAAEPCRVIVFARSRDVVEKAREALSKLAGSAPGRGGVVPETELLVSDRRVREREAAERRLIGLGFLDGRERPVDHAFLFATAAGEVCADLVADHLVADVVGWERTILRLGLVNRRGDGAAETVFVVGPESSSEPSLQLLQQLPDVGAGARDGSPAAIEALATRRREEVEAAFEEPPVFPDLTRPVVDAWSMTSLEQHAGRPEVAPWLRGWAADAPRTGVAWRRHLPRASHADAFFEAAPPHASELVETETDRVCDWLLARAARIGAGADPRFALSREDVVAFALDPSCALRRWWSLDELGAIGASRGRDRLQRELASSQLVIDRRLGGLTADGLLDAAVDAPPDTADGPDWMPSADGVPIVRFRVEIRGDDRDGTRATQDANWRERLRIPWGVDADEEVRAWLVVDKWRHDAATEDDRSSGRPQSLEEHQAWTADEAARIARRVALPPRVAEALEVAARLHDEGKRSSRWQRAFHAPDGDVWAKTRGPVNAPMLDGYRHELGSLPVAEADARVRALDSDLQGLVLHLVAAHHGFARPTIPTTGFDDAPPTAQQGLARSVASRFAEQGERWGPWGLAWLEALLRAADQLASRRNDAESP